MKNYLLFYYRGFYPSGAFNDYVDSFDSPQDVFDYIQNLPKLLKEDVCGGSLTFQILDLKDFSVLTLDNIENISDILSTQKYIPVKRSEYFDVKVEEYKFEEGLYD